MYEGDDYYPYESVGEQLGFIFWIMFGVANVAGFLMYIAI